MSDVYLHFQLRELYRQYYRCDKLICLLIKANTWKYLSIAHLK